MFNFAGASSSQTHRIGSVHSGYACNPRSALVLNSRVVAVAAQAVARDATEATNVASYSTGHVQQHTSVACYATDPPQLLDNAQWPCHTTEMQSQSSRHLESLPLHMQHVQQERQLDVHSQSPPFRIPKGTASALAPDSAVQTLQEQQQQQHMLQHQQVPVLPAGNGSAVQDSAQAANAQQQLQQYKQSRSAAQHAGHSTVAHTQQPQQKQPTRQHKQRLRLRHRPGSTDYHTVPVANTTNPTALAGHLLKRRKQELRQQQHRDQLHPNSSASSSTTQAVVLTCSSSTALHAALCAVGIAARHAAALLQPQQLLLQPQLVRNALAEAADGGCNAAVYQLQVCWVPMPLQLLQQQERRALKQQKQQAKQQEQRHHCTVAAAGAVEGQACTEEAAAKVSTAAVRRQHIMCCDPAVHKHHSSSSRKRSVGGSSQQQPLHVKQLVRRVHGLLRGNWPAGLAFQSPAGALLAIKALVQARSQLQAGGQDLMLAVEATTSVQQSATGVVVDAAAASTVRPPSPEAAAAAPGNLVQSLMLWAVVCPALPAAAKVSQQAEVTAMPAAETVLARQQQERCRAKQLRATLWQQQHMQQEQQTVLSAEQQQQRWQQQQPAADRCNGSTVHLSGATAARADVVFTPLQQQNYVPMAVQQQQQQHNSRRLKLQQSGRPNWQQHDEQIPPQQQEALNSVAAEAAAAKLEPRNHSSAYSMGLRHDVGAVVADVGLVGSARCTGQLLYSSSSSNGGTGLAGSHSSGVASEQPQLQARG